MTLLELAINLTVNDSEVNAKIQGVADNTKKLGDETDKLSAGTVMLGNLLTQAFNAATSALKGLVQQGVSYNAQMESFTTRLTTALNSAEAAENAIAAIKRDASQSVFDVNSLVQANSLLISTGESADESRRAINALANAVAASGGGNDVLQRMASNLQQIKNVGKATSMDIRQFAMAGIDVYGILADSTGKTVAEVQELDITYEMLTNALVNAQQEGGKYAGAMEAMTETWNGQVNKLQANVKDKLGMAFEGVFDVLESQILPATNEWLDSLDEGDAQRILGDIAIAVAAIGAAVVAIKWSSITAGLSKIAAGFEALLLNPAVLAIAAVAGVVIGIRELGAAAKEAGADMIDSSLSIEELNQQLIDAEAEYARIKADWESGYGESTYTDVKRAEGAVEAARQAVQNYADTVGVATDETGKLDEEQARIAEFQATFQAAFEESQKAIEKYFDTFEQVDKIEAVSGGIQTMTDALQSQIDFLNTYNADLESISNAGLTDIAQAMQKLGTDGAGYARALAEALADSGGQITPEIQGLMDAFSGLSEAQNELAGTQGLIDTIMAGDTESAASAAQAMASAMEGAYSQIVESHSKTTEELGALSTDLQTVATDMQTAASNMVDGLDLYDSTFSAGVNTIRGFIDGLNNQVGNATSTAYNIGRNLAAAVQNGVNSYGTISIVASVRSTGGVRNRSGLDYIPYDEFPALLHEGERVLTKEENKNYTAGETGAGGGININQTIAAVAQTPAEFASAALAYFEEARWAL